MARRRIETDLQSLGRRPQAATFQALNVPHVGPQRREDQSSNYERLAQSLGKFSNALENTSVVWAKEHAQRQEEEGRRLATSAQMTTEQRAQYRTVHGNEPLSDTVQSIAEVNYNTIEKLDQEHLTRVTQLEDNGWLLDNEDGTQRAMTAADIDAEWRQRNTVKVWDVYGEDPAYTKQRTLLLAATTKHRDDMLRRLNAYNEKQQEKAGQQSVLGLTLSDATSAKARGLTGDAFTQAILGGAAVTYKTAKGSYNDTGPERERLVNTVIDSFQHKIHDPQVARFFVEFAHGRMDENVPSPKDHPAYEKVVTQVLKSAYETIARDDHAKAVEVKNLEILRGMADGKTFWEASGGKGTETPRPTQGEKYTETIEKHRDFVSEAYDKRATERYDMVRGDANQILMGNQSSIMHFAGTGLQPKRLVNFFDEIELNKQDIQDDPDKLVVALSAFRDIREFDGQNLEKYVKDKATRVRLDAINDMLEESPEIGPQEAAARVLAAEDDEGVVRDLYKPFEKDGDVKAVRDEAYEAGLTPSEFTEVTQRANYLLAGRAMTPAEYAEQLQKITKNFLARRVVINGSILRTPEGVDPKRYGEYVEQAIKDVVRDYKLPYSPEHLTVKSVPGAFYLVSKESGRVIRLPGSEGNKNKWAVFSHKDVLKYSTDKLSAENEKRATKGRNSILDRKEIDRQIDEAKKEQASQKNWLSQFIDGPMTDAEMKLRELGIGALQGIKKNLTSKPLWE